jgi:hypothetical protein
MFTGEARTSYGEQTMTEVNTQEARSTDVLRVFQSKDETRAFYDRISLVYELLSDRSEAPVKAAGSAGATPATSTSW